MASLTLTNLPEELYQRIAERARASGRSVEEEAQRSLAQAIADSQMDEEQLLAEIRADREELARKGVFVTDEILQAAKQGRE